MKKLRFYLLFLLLALCLLPLSVGNAQAKYVKTITLAPVDIQIDGSYSVTYHGNNGNFGSAAVTTNVVYYKPGTNEVVSGSVKNPTWADHVFLGLWYKDPGCTDPFDPANDPQNLTGNIDVYARFVGSSNVLDTGADFNNTVASKFRTATHFVFTDTVGPSSATDVSAANDGGVVAWQSGTTCYVSTQRSGIAIRANSSSDYMFRENTVVKNIDFQNINASAAKTMQRVFYGASSLETILNFDKFNTAKPTSINHMFQGCTKLKEVDVTGLNVSGIEVFQYLFKGCSSLKTLDLSKWNTSAATSMGEMFSGCTGLTSLNISGFNTSKVKNFYGMFLSCSGLTGLDLSNFNTSSATEMRSMFSGCTNLRSLNVTSFNTSKVGGMSGMFKNCKNLTTLNLSNFNTNAVFRMDEMFYGCSGLTTVYVSPFDSSKKTGWTVGGLTVADSGDNAGKLQDVNMFLSCEKLVGGKGTTYQYASTNLNDGWQKSEMARIDGGPTSATPGYFTDIADKGTELLSLTGENGTYTGIQ